MFAASDDCTATYTLNSETNMGSVAVTSPPANWVVGEACVPNGPDPVVCSGAIDHAGRAVTYSAHKVGDPLPSQWRYTNTAKDPPAVIEAWGLTAGYSDVSGIVEFDSESNKEPHERETPC